MMRCTIRWACFLGLGLTLAACGGRTVSGAPSDDEAGEAEANGADVGEDGTSSVGGEDETGTGAAPDSDGDGLDDDEEETLGTDPYNKDTDGDTYWDSWEVWEGTDPLDYNNRIYTGFWPYNPDKELLEQGDWLNAARENGVPMARFEMLDQFSELVDYYDLSGAGLYQIVDVCAIWCGPCRNLAAWHMGDIDQNNQFIEEAYPTVRQKIHDEKIMFVTVLVNGQDGGPPMPEELVDWWNDYPDPLVPIFGDEAQDFHNAYGAGYFPDLFLVYPDMKGAYFTDGSGGTSDDPYPALGIVENEMD